MEELLKVCNINSHNDIILSNYFVSIQGRYFVIVTTIVISNHQLILMKLVILQIINDMISELNASYSCENHVTLHSGRKKEDGFCCLYVLSKLFIIIYCFFYAALDRLKIISLRKLLLVLKSPLCGHFYQPVSLWNKVNMVTHL